MNRPSSDPVLRRLRRLEIYAGVSSLLLLVLGVTAFAPGRQDAGVIEARRLEILNDDGGRALVIAGRGNLPGPTVEGVEYPRELSGGRTRASGMIFFNERGDEVGGLTFHGQLDDDGYAASGLLAFDQFRQDQVVAVQYQDDGARRSAGLNIWDRSPDIPIGRVIEIADARARATGAERDSLEGEIRELAAQGLSAHRVFLGSRDRTAALLLRDPDGRPRIRLFVDSASVARLEFLDESGAVVRAYPE